MFGAIAKAVFGSSNDRYVKSLDKIVKQIASFEANMEAMTDEELTGQTAKFRQRLADGVELDDLLPEAFATVREAAPFAPGVAVVVNADDVPRRKRLEETFVFFGFVHGVL